MKRCCILGCDDKSSRRFRLPTDSRIRSLWLERTGDSSLARLTNKDLRVCAAHFDERCLNSNGKLLRFSIPTLHLPGFHQPASANSDCFSYPEEGYRGYQTPEKIRDSLQLPSTSSRSSPDELLVKLPKIVYAAKGLKKKLFGAGPGESSQNVITDTQPSTSFASPVEQSVSINLSEITNVSDLTSASQPITELKLKAHKKTSLLRSLGVTRVNHLGAEGKSLYKRARYLQQAVSKLKSRQISLKHKIKYLQSKDFLLAQLNDVNEVTAQFIWSQLKNQKYKPKGRRFTVKDKTFALALYKQSGKAYRYLSKFFSLPSKKVLTAILNKVPFNTGINESIFNHLKERVAKKRMQDKLCVLMFDEVKLSTGLQYNSRRDSIDGFVDYGGCNRKLSFADHALTFMVKGICTKWKQVVWFSFCEGTTPTADLKHIIKSVVTNVENCGLKIVATISDQGSTNQAAINQLVAESSIQNNADLLRYKINDEEIIHMFDFPHLMKCIRNMMLAKNLHFSQDGVEKVASWSYVIRLYEMDKSHGSFSQFVKLTDEHIYPTKLKKMKVKNCTQVFSRTVATSMKLSAEVSKELAPDSEHYIDPKASETADLLLFFDQLFDSINGGSLQSQPGKELRTVVKPNSQHVTFWKQSLPVLASMYFTENNSQKQIRPPCLKNWLFSIRALIYITPKLWEYKLKHFAPRAFNQDPLENFFSAIRSYGHRNINPTCSAFISSCKSLLVNNFTSSHSAGANCEDDESTGPLDNLTSFIEQPVAETVTPYVPPIMSNFRSCPSDDLVGKYCTSYVAGYVGRKLMQSISCDTCKERMRSDIPLEENRLIAERQYENCQLFQPNRSLNRVFRKVINTLLAYIPTKVLCFDLRRELRQLILSKYSSDISLLFCDQHKHAIHTFVNISSNVILFSYISNVNKMLNGKDLRYKNQDAVFKLAYDKLRKTKKS